MDVAAFVIACAAFALSVLNFGWRLFEWWHARRFDVRVRLEQEGVVVGSGKYELTVVVENFGATDEAVQEVSLQYARSETVEAERARYPDLHDWRGERVEPVPAKRDTVAELLPPRRSVRRTYDLLEDAVAWFPVEVVAVVLLQSARRVESRPYRPDNTLVDTALAGRSKPSWG